MSVPKITRPILRYHGGKYRLAPWIIEHFPAHRVYVEPFGGAGSVLLRKPRSYGEVYNDLDGEIVNLFRVARESGEKLVDLIELTPFSREDYKLSFELSTDPIEQARRTCVRSFMGFGSNALNRAVNSGFRSNANRSGTTPSHDWRNYPESLLSVIDRLRGVVIENKDALALMRQHDSPETLHYCDPPYVHSTRTAKHGYSHEMNNGEHEAFMDMVIEIEGMCIISGYKSDLYDDALSGWNRVEKETHADGAKDRVEVLWMNYPLP